MGAQGVARDGSHPLPCRRSRRSVPPMPSVGVLLMRWLRWQWVISTLVEDHLMIRADRGGQVTRGDQDSVDGWERTFPSTLSMLQLASRHRICIVNIFYRKHFVSFVLPEELDDGCRIPQGSRSCPEQLLARGPSQRRPFPPIDLGSSRSTLVAKGVAPSRPQVNRSKGPPLGGTPSACAPKHPHPVPDVPASHASAAVDL